MLLFQKYSLGHTADAHGTLLCINCETEWAYFATANLRLYNFPHRYYLPLAIYNFLSSDLCQIQESEHWRTFDLI